MSVEFPWNETKTARIDKGKTLASGFDGYSFDSIVMNGNYIYYGVSYYYMKDGKEQSIKGTDAINEDLIIKSKKTNFHEMRS